MEDVREGMEQRLRRSELLYLFKTLSGAAVFRFWSSRVNDQALLI